MIVYALATYLGTSNFDITQYKITCVNSLPAYNYWCKIQCIDLVYYYFFYLFIAKRYRMFQTFNWLLNWRAALPIHSGYVKES